MVITRPSSTGQKPVILTSTTQVDDSILYRVNLYKTIKGKHLMDQDKKSKRNEKRVKINQLARKEN